MKKIKSLKIDFSPKTLKERIVQLWVNLLLKFYVSHVKSDDEITDIFK